MKERKDLKVLLLQIRENQKVMQEELESFASYGQLELNQIQSHNVFTTPVFDKSILQHIDLLFVGGASEASVLEPIKYPFVDSIKKLMNDSLELNIPVFASCFGFQAAVLAFGGEILRDKENFEMGTYPISLTKEALTDPVYKNTSDGFYAVSVHQEKAIQLPANCELLAYTSECCHSFKVKEKPFWAFQFHPELDKKCLTQRLGIYRDKYTEDKDHFDQIIKSIRETTESNNLVSNFVDHFCLANIQFDLNSK